MKSLEEKAFNEIKEQLKETTNTDSKVVDILVDTLRRVSVLEKQLKKQESVFEKKGKIHVLKNQDEMSQCENCTDHPMWAESIIYINGKTLKLCSHCRKELIKQLIETS